MLRRVVTLLCLAVGLGIFSGSAARIWAQASPLQDVPEQLVRAEEGFALDLEGGFELGKQQGGYYLLGSRTIPGLILVRAMPGLTAADLNRTLRSGYDDPTVQLTPDGPVTDLTFEGGFGKLAEVRGTLLEDQVQGLLAGYLREGGGGLLLFAVTSSDQWAKLSPVAEKVAASVKLFIPEPQELIRLWTERVAGFKLLSDAESNTGPSRKQNRTEPGEEEARVYSLCSDGSFLYQEGEEREAPETQPGSTPENIAGAWQIVPTGLRVDLLFTFQDGKSHTYRLTRRDQETYLDDQRYYVLPNEQCR